MVLIIQRLRVRVVRLAVTMVLIIPRLTLTSERYSKLCNNRPGIYRMQCSQRHCKVKGNRIHSSVCALPRQEYHTLQDILHTAYGRSWNLFHLQKQI